MSMIKWIDTIQRCFELNAVYFTIHAKREMESEEFGPISTSEVVEAVESLEVIVEYLDDLPYPSALILGFTSRLRPLHVVCAFNDIEDSLIIVTVYQPDPERWENLRTRKRT